MVVEGTDRKTDRNCLLDKNKCPAHRVGESFINKGALWITRTHLNLLKQYEHCKNQISTQVTYLPHRFWAHCKSLLKGKASVTTKMAAVVSSWFQHRWYLKVIWKAGIKLKGLHCQLGCWNSIWAPFQGPAAIPTWSPEGIPGSSLACHMQHWHPIWALVPTAIWEVGHKTEESVFCLTL